MRTTITTYHLEMTSPDQLAPSTRWPDGLAITRAHLPSPPLNRFLYTAVGGDWHWTDRLTWTYDDWMTWLDREALETWVAYYRGTPAGYVELELQQAGDVEIAYFGLIAQFVGFGIGGVLLTEAIRRAWAMGARRVWVHTCTLDHPHALKNYQARGFRLIKTVESEHDVDLTPGPWPGASQLNDRK